MKKSSLKTNAKFKLQHENLGDSTEVRNLQAETEGATRRELEDMMVLIEKHFKESQAARRMAEEGLDEAQRAMQEYAHKWERLEQENQRLAK